MAGTHYLSHYLLLPKVHSSRKQNQDSNLSPPGRDADNPSNSISTVSKASPEANACTTPAYLAHEKDRGFTRQSSCAGDEFIIYLILKHVLPQMVIPTKVPFYVRELDEQTGIAALWDCSLSCFATYFQDSG